METDAGHVVTQINQLCGIGKRQRLQEHILDHGEDGAVRTNADRQRGDGGEVRRFAQYAQAEAQVLCEILEPSDSADIAAPLLALLDSAHFYECLPTRVFRG
jgi:hypothetical protein